MWEGKLMLFWIAGILLAIGTLVCFLFGLGAAKVSSDCSRGEEKSELYMLTKKHDADNNKVG